MSVNNGTVVVVHVHVCPYLYPPRKIAPLTPSFLTGAAIKQLLQSFEAIGKYNIPKLLVRGGEVHTRLASVRIVSLGGEN